MGIVYLTTNLVNGKKYIGSHHSSNDDYLGSGVLISKAIKKYGKSNFERIILWEGPEELKLLKEEEFCELYDVKNNKEFYNLTNKGTGLPKDFKFSEEIKEKYKQVRIDRLNKFRKSEIGDWIKTTEGQEHIKKQIQYFNTTPEIINRRNETLRKKYLTSNHHLKGVPKTNEWKKSMTKKIECILPNGEVKIFSGNKEVTSFFNMSTATLYKLLNKENVKKYDNYIFNKVKK
jgi:predicted DNA-binding transcriptional regulator AlpA